MPRDARRSVLGTHRLATWGLAIAALTACDQPALNPTTPSARPPAIQAYVTGDAARDLGAEGRFVLAAGPSGSAEEPIITPERARELALSYARTWGRFYREDWGKERGSPVDPASLTADPRVFYAETAFGPVPDGYHPAFRRMFGAWYLVTLVQGGSPALLVGVSAYNTEMEIDGHGRLIEPMLSGTDFAAVGIASRAGAAGLRPITPEQAVEAVGRRTGARTRQTPAYFLLGKGAHPGDALWRLNLDRPVRIRTGNAARQVQTLFAGAAGRFFIPKADQPASFRGTGILYHASGERIGPAPLEVPVKPGAVAEYDEVTLDEPEA